MSDVAPPTVPGPLMPCGPRERRGKGAGLSVLRGMGFHAGLAAAACMVAPLAMGSNIWPIAGVFWAAFMVPGAMATGACVGWIVRKRSLGVALGVIVATGVLVAAGVGVVIVRNG